MKLRNNSYKGTKYFPLLFTPREEVPGTPGKVVSGYLGVYLPKREVTGNSPGSKISGPCNIHDAEDPESAPNQLSKGKGNRQQAKAGKLLQNLYGLLRGIKKHSSWLRMIGPQNLHNRNNYLSQESRMRQISKRFEQK